MGEFKIDSLDTTIFTGGGSFLRTAGGIDVSLAFPRFCFKELNAAPDFVFSTLLREHPLLNGGHEYTLLFTARDGLLLEADVQTFPHSPALRFRIRLTTTGFFILTSEAASCTRLFPLI
ncbi:MAG: hypothetical protein LBD18_06115 [Treponema sp.]|jgi:hypothetical protein|nr:hypothetical protein [Treponema sp.]